MNDYRRGYPIDLRPAAMRARKDRSHIGDFELAAARVVARFSGERVLLEDDNSSPGMVDIRIDYRATAAGFVEVVTDIESGYSALVENVRRNQEVRAEALRRVWYVTLDAQATVRDLVRDLPRRLTSLEGAGVLFDSLPQPFLDDHEHDAVRQLAGAGVVELASSPTNAGEPGRILLYARGIEGPPLVDWSAFDTWLTDYLHHVARSDVRNKLAATGAAERHVFVGLSFTTPWEAIYALGRESCDLPPTAPSLPGEVTHVWLWAYPIGRCIAWFPDRGWFEPRDQWATE